MPAWDPYLALAEETAFVDYLAPGAARGPLDFLLEVTPDGAEELRRLARDGVEVNVAHLDAGSRFVTARMTTDDLQRLQSRPDLLASIELAEGLRHQRSQPYPPRTGAYASANLSARIKPAGDTLAALIDDGCPFAHREFRRRGGGTRVATLWDMDPNPELEFEGSAPPAGFGRGREVPRAQLDRWIRQHTEGDGYVDEAACYAAAGYSAVEVELTHGSHLLGRLAGASYSRYPDRPDPAASCDIAFIQLPRRESEAPGAGSIHATVLDALRYLRGFAQANGYRRCVVGCARGSLLGPHDGSSLFERALDAFLNEGSGKEPGVEFRIVFAAGNSYDSKLHAVLKPKPRQNASIAWLLPADNEVATFAELWIDGPPENVRISVQTGTQSKLLAPGVTTVEPWLIAWRGEAQVCLRAAPTRLNDEHARSVPAPPGPVILVAESPDGEATVHGYLCWGGRNLGAARATRQADWLLVQDSANSVLEGRGTLAGDACSTHRAITVVGGYVGGSPPHRASYSSAGPGRGGGRVGPDFLAMSDQDAATPGVLGPGTRSGSDFRVWGTSVAVPQAARAIINGEPLPSEDTTAPGAGDPEEIGAGFLRPMPGDVPSAQSV